VKRDVGDDFCFGEQITPLSLARGCTHCGTGGFKAFAKHLRLMFQTTKRKGSREGETRRSSGVGFLIRRGAPQFSVRCAGPHEPIPPCGVYSVPTGPSAVRGFYPQQTTRQGHTREGAWSGREASRASTGGVPVRGAGGYRSVSPQLAEAHDFGWPSCFAHRFCAIVAAFDCFFRNCLLWSRRTRYHFLTEGQLAMWPWTF